MHVKQYFLAPGWSKRRSTHVSAVQNRPTLPGGSSLAAADQTETPPTCILHTVAEVGMQVSSLSQTTPHAILLVQ